MEEIDSTTIKIYEEDLRRIRKIDAKNDQDRFRLYIQKCERTEFIYVSLETPNFLFSKTAKNDGLYRYLKEHPEASEFIYRKYKDNREFLEELCTPGNPLYLEDVKNHLQDAFTFRDLKAETASLFMQRNNLRAEIASFNEDKASLAPEVDDLDNKIETKKKELGDLERMIGNLFTDRGLKHVRMNIDSTLDVLDSIIGSGTPNDWASKGRTLNLETLERIWELKKATESLKNEMQESDFLNPDLLDGQRRTYLDERDTLLEENTILADNSIRKNQNKALEFFDRVLNHFASLVESGNRAFSVTQLSGYVGQLTEARDILQNNEKRISNLLNRKS